MVEVRGSIFTLGGSGKDISIAERSISTIGSSGKSISISIAGKSLPMAMMSISTIGAYPQVGRSYPFPLLGEAYPPW